MTTLTQQGLLVQTLHKIDARASCSDGTCCGSAKKKVSPFRDSARGKAKAKKKACISRESNTGLADTERLPTFGNG
jgi:hypothetical protein